MEGYILEITGDMRRVQFRFDIAHKCARFVNAIFSNNDDSYVKYCNSLSDGLTEEDTVTIKYLSSQRTNAIALVDLECLCLSMRLAIDLGKSSLKVSCGMIGLKRVFATLLVSLSYISYTQNHKKEFAEWLRNYDREKCPENIHKQMVDEIVNSYLEIERFTDELSQKINEYTEENAKHGGKMIVGKLSSQEREMIIHALEQTEYVALIAYDDIDHAFKFKIDDGIWSPPLSVKIDADSQT